MAPVPGVSAAQTIACLIIASFYGSFIFISTIIYFVQGRRDQHLSKRSLWLTSLGGISNAFLSTSFLMGFGFYDSYPCVMDFLADYLGVIPLCLTVVGRGIRLVFIVKLQLSFAPSNVRSLSLTRQSPLGHAEIITAPAHSTMFSFFPSSQAVLERRLGASLGIILFVNVVYTFFTLMYTRTVDPGPGGPPPSIGVFPVMSYNCTGAPGFLPFYIVIGCYFILCPVVLFYGWKLRDAYGIRNSLVYSICIGMPCFVMYLVWAFYFEKSYGKYFSSLLWPMPTFFAIHWTSVIVPLWNYRRKKSFGRNPPDSSEFERVLASPIEFSQFCRHSVEHFVAEHTRFLEDYQILKVKTIESFIDTTPNRYRDLPPARADPAVLAPLHIPQYKRPRSSTSPVSPTAAPLLSSRWPHQLARNTSSIDIYTVPPPTISMLQSVLPYLPPGSPPSVVPVPEELKSQYRHFYMTFIRPGGILETNLTNAVWCKVAQAVEQDELHIDMFEEAKREVLDLLFFNTFPTFMDKHENELWKPIVTMQGHRSSGQSSRVGLSSWSGRPTTAEMIVLELI